MILLIDNLSGYKRFPAERNHGVCDFFKFAIHLP